MSEIRSLRVTTYPKDEDLEPYVSQIIHYDQSGNELARYEYRGPDVFESKVENRYNDKNEVIETTTYMDDTEIAERRIYTRNDAGKIEQVQIEYSDGSVSIQTIERDLQSRTENWVERDEDDELESREFLKFNENDKVILRELYDFNNKLTEAYEYEYFPDGSLFKRRQLDERRKLILETEYKYNESGSLVLRVSHNRRGELSDFLKIEYNDQEQVIRQSFSGHYNFKYEYDEQGNPVVEEEYNGDMLDNRITSEFNADNRIIYEDQVKYSKKFEYEYFD